MKRDVWLFLLALAFAAGLGACNDEVFEHEEKPGDDIELTGTTYVGLTLRMPTGTLRAADDEDYNYQGSYSGYIGVEHLDVYLYTADGSTQLMAKRFSTLGTDFTLEIKNGQEFIQIAAPFKANPGEVMGLVVVNCNSPLIGADRGSNEVFNDMLYKNARRSTDFKSLMADGFIGDTQTASALTVAGISNTEYIVDPADNNTTVYKETITMSGQSERPFIIQDGVSRDDVLIGRLNVLTLDVTKVVSKAIVTYGISLHPRIYKDDDGPKAPTDGWLNNVYGTISNLTYSVAQGANAAYLFRRLTPEGRTMTWGYDFVPGPAAGSEFESNASKYYEYADLQNNRILGLTPVGTNVAALPGAYLFPNTHQWGADAASSGYRKGNTAYALIRAKFTPDASVVWRNGSFGTVGGANGLAADGTFYLGYLDRIIYASLADAQSAAASDFGSQPVQTYVGGKMLYHIWLNPDNADDPTKWVNSPVIRNNIYHINIRSIKRLGANWNPLVPPDVTNPDPKPEGPEPPIPPVDPTDPLVDGSTYMSVELNFVPWTVHLYHKVL